MSILGQPPRELLTTPDPDRKDSIAQYNITKAAKPHFFMIPHGYKCLGGYFKSLISNYSPDFLFF